MALADAPDKVIWTQPVDIVDGTPTPAEPANEVATGGYGIYYGADTTYQTVVSWTVSAGKIGELNSIVCGISNGGNVDLKVTIGATVYELLGGVISPAWYFYNPLKLAAGAVVKVEARAITGGAGNEIWVEVTMGSKEIG